MSVSEVPLAKMTLYGFIGPAMIPLASIGLLDNSKRSEVIENILSDLSSNDKVIFGETLIFTESYDAFRIL